MRSNRSQGEQDWIENKSAGLKLFLLKLSKSKRPVVLDAGIMSGITIQYLTSRGYKVYADNIVESSFHGKLDYHQGQFDGIILWESIDKIGHTQAEKLFDEVERVLKPGGIAFMVTSSHSTDLPEGALRFRIREEELFEHSLSDDTLIHKYHYTNRELMRLLERFKTLCFNLLKTGNREIVFEKVADTNR